MAVCGFRSPPIMPLTHTSALTVGLERYIVYPTGIDFGKMLMTRQSERTCSLSYVRPFVQLPSYSCYAASSSQSVPIPRLSGGAVPGGRGVGVIDVEQEQTRDAEYHVRVREGGDPFSLSATREMFTNAMTADGTSLIQGDAPPITQRPQVDSVTKTPSSSARKRGSTSTPRTASATAAFVDHVIELPTDDDAMDGQHNPVNDRRRVKTPLGSRARPRSVSRSSSVGLFSNGEVEVAPPLRTSSSGNGGKGKEKEKSEAGKRRPNEEGDEDEDVFQTSRKSKARVSQRRLDAQDEQTEDEPEKQASAQARKPRRQIIKRTTVGSDSEASSAAGAGNGSERGSVPPRRAVGAGSATPVKSGMKPKSKSVSRPWSVAGGESEDEVRKLAAGSGTVTETGKGREQSDKLTRNGEIGTKGKKKEKASEGRKEAPQSTSRPQPPMRSPLSTSPKTTNGRPLKRRLSVVVPSVPKDYFSSQQSVRNAEEYGKSDDEHEREKTGATTGSAPRGKQLVPAASVCAVSAEASTSTSKRAKPLPAKSMTAVSKKSGAQPQAKSKHKPKPGGSKETAKTHADEDEEMNEVEDANDTSMAVESVASSSRGGPRRSAANKASTRLREEIMPDVISFEKERKQAKRRRSGDWESVSSVREVEEEEKRLEKSGKRRKVSKDEEEEVEEAEVEVVVLAKPKPRQSIGKGKEKGRATVGSDEEMGESPAKSKLGKKKSGGVRGKEPGVIRLMTTGVALSDDVVKVCHSALPDKDANVECFDGTASHETGGADDDKTDGLHAPRR